MQIRVVRAAALAAGVMLGSFIQPLARGEDQPKDSPPAQREKAPNGGDQAGPAGAQAFPMLDRVRSVLGDLKLSDEQKGKIDKIVDDTRSQLKKIREDPAGDRQELMQKSREAFTKLRDEVSGVLTDEQKAQFKEKFQSIGQGGGNVMSRLKSSLEKLNLTDDQKQKVKELLDDTAKQAKDLREKAQGGGDDAAQKLRALMQDTREKLGEILTDEQKQKLQESFQPGGAGGDGGARNRTEKQNQ